MSLAATVAPPHASATEPGPPERTAARAVDSAAALVQQLLDEAASVDADGAFPTRSFELLRAHGLLRAPLAATYGGCALGATTHRLQLLQVLAHLGRGSLPVGRIYEGHVNALALIDAFGSPRQIGRWSDDAARGHLFAVWNTEAGDGLRLPASRDGRFVLAGSKTFASGAGIVSRALVTARDATGGWQMLVVPLDVTPPGIDRSFWKPLGMRPSGSFKVDFNGIAVEDDDLLGRPGDYYHEPMFGSGAVRFAAVQLGGIEAVFDATRQFLRRLGRTDDPYQRARIGEMAMLAASGRQWIAGAAAQAVAAPLVANDRLAANDEHAGAVAHAHLTRTAIEAIALRMLQLAERCVGARGLMAPEPFERMHRDLTHYLRQAAPDAAIAAAGEYALARPEAAHELWQST